MSLHMITCCGYSSYLERSPFLPLVTDLIMSATCLGEDRRKWRTDAPLKFHVEGILGNFDE